ncbi:MAG: MBL fold metallo-hydrolase [Proteobacteria bacterium]|nr:MBL fold metallo-hydrolase [Pseudomonadota bacterium]
MIFWFAIGFAPCSSAQVELEGFCANLPRPAYSAFEKHHTSNEWFEVYEVEPNIWAIYEPFQWQEVISYLIVGTDSALLFDTGNGLGDIRAIVDQLTKKPVTVLNSHSHFDHIGGNYQFDNIVSVSTAFSLANSRGIQNEMVTTEASSEALCKALPSGVTQGSHQIKPYTITRKISEGDVIDLGDRKLEILHISGHTDDSIALLDAEAGFLWTGDSFYEGPIWLYFPETDLAAYRKSIARLAALAPQLNALFPAHNTPKAVPALLLGAQQAFDLVLEGKAEPVPMWEGVVTFQFDGFGFLMREDNTQL